MSFNTRTSVQHRAWNLFLRKKSNAVPETVFPFLVAGSAGGEPAVFYSNDPGAGFVRCTLLSTPLPTTDCRILAIGPNKAFVVTPEGIFSSDDGVTFTLAAPYFFDPAVTFYPAAYGNGLYVVSFEGQGFFSIDGLNWTVADSFGSGNLICFHKDAFYNATSDIFSNAIFKSFDGIVGIPVVPVSVQAPPFGSVSTVENITSDGENLFVSVQVDGTTAGQQKTIIYQSADDGANWTVARNIISATTVLPLLGAGGSSAGAVYARDASGARYVRTLGDSFLLRTSPISGAVMLGVRRGVFFEIDSLGNFAYSTDGVNYNGVIVPIDFSASTA